MPYRNRKSSYNNFILVFVTLKVILNALAISRFGFHRDELLHLALANHMDWGYKEVPPFIAFLAKITHVVLGDSLFASRIFSTLFAALIVWLTGKITVEFGGKRFAIALACSAMVFSPSFAGSGYLFQPVVFDQFWWVLTVWLLVRYINNNSSPKYLYFIGMAIGVGLLTKYTMGFFAGCLIISLLFTKQRRLLWNKHMAGAAGVALLLFLPNLLWQYHHHWPVVSHMAELKKTQLDFIKPLDFTLEQLLCHGMALFVWLTGFFFLLFSFKLRKFQFLAFAYLLIFLFLMEMNGKGYYMLGAYPMLFAAGGYGFERWIKAPKILRMAVIGGMALPNILLLPVVLPVLPFNNTLSYFDFIMKHKIMSSLTVWEDQKQHATTQDYADMLGWDEMVKKVAGTYNSMSTAEQKETVIYAGNYGEAGALYHFGPQYGLPEAVCLNSSFSLWAPPQLSGTTMIYISDSGDEDIATFHTALHSYTKLDSVTNTYARERETGIFLLKPSPQFYKGYQKRYEESRKK